MTAAIHSFPSAFDREQLTFQRTGASNYTRACDEGAELGRLVFGQGEAAPAQRIEAFEAAIDWLRHHRPEVAQDMIQVDGCGQIQLRCLPQLIRAAQARLARAHYPAKSANDHA